MKKVHTRFRHMFLNVSNLGYIFMFISFFTFFFQLSNFKKITFDEFHYIPAAKQWLTMAPTTNVEHPPLGKYLIAVGIKVFGDNPIGWRAASAIAGSIAIVFCFLITYLIYIDLILASSIAFFSLFNFWFFVQSRIGMLDIFMVTFYLGGIYYFLKYKYDINDRYKNVSYFISALCWGLAVSIKWSAAFIYLPFFILAIISDLTLPIKSNNLKKVLYRFFLFGLLSITVYFITFVPYLFVSGNFRFSLLDIFLKVPSLMLELQKSVAGKHPYYSDWYTWPLMIRPIWYDFMETVDHNFFRGLLLIGNPFQMFLGAMSVVYLIFKWKSLQILTKFTLVLFLSSWLIWGIAPRKMSFFYYFFPSAVFYSFLIPMTLREVMDIKKVNKFMVPITIISFGFFLYFYPILSGQLTPTDLKGRWMWFQNWI